MKQYKVWYHYRNSYFEQDWESERLKKTHRGQKTIIVSNVDTAEEARLDFNRFNNQTGWKTIDKIKKIK